MLLYVVYIEWWRLAMHCIGRLNWRQSQFAFWLISFFRTNTKDLLVLHLTRVRFELLVPIKCPLILLIYMRQCTILKLKKQNGYMWETFENLYQVITYLEILSIVLVFYIWYHKLICSELKLILLRWAILPLSLWLLVRRYCSGLMKSFTHLSSFWLSPTWLAQKQLYKSVCRFVWIS